VCFEAADPLFDGHFPHAPILPGVALIDAAVALASRAVGRALRLERVANAKFVSAVQPGQEIALGFKVAREPGDPGRVTVNARWTRGAERVADIAFTAVAADAEGSVP